MFVATVGHVRVGYLIILGGKINAILTDNRLRRKGIAMLVDAAEIAALDAGSEELDAQAFIDDEAFYARLGFEVIDKPDKNHVIMRKEL